VQQVEKSSSAETDSPRADRKGTFVAWRQREVIAREFAPLPAEEIPGRRFAERLARSLADTPSITLQEWSRLYRIVVPRTPNGRGGPRSLEQAWQARRLRSEGKTRRKIAVELGLISLADIERAKADYLCEAKVATAEKRITRNERLLVACEQRIVKADLIIPGLLTNPS
jgi:hypothetical protein